jgi:Ion channel
MLRHLEDRYFDDGSPHVDNFGLLVVVSVAAIVVGSLVDIRPGGDGRFDGVGVVVATAVTGAMLALALRASGVARRTRLPFEIVIAAGVTLTLVLVAVGAATDRSLVTSPEGRPGPSWLWVLMAAVVPLLIIRRLIRQRTVSTGTLLGAVCVYLSIVVAFFFLFLTVDAYGSAPLFGEQEPTTTFMYLSLQSVTTLGSGDVVPQTNLGRLLSTGEAVIGQLFLVSFFAMFVSMFVGARTAPRREP